MRRRNCMDQQNLPGREGLTCTRCQAKWPKGIPPQALKGERVRMVCREEGCERRAHTRGWCTSHYRRHQSGAAMDEPIRPYKRQRPRPLRREYPFKKELELLRELGLR